MLECAATLYVVEKAIGLAVLAMFILFFAGAFAFVTVDNWRAKRRRARKKAAAAERSL